MMGGGLDLFRDFREFPGFSGKILDSSSLIGLFRDLREFPGFPGKILGFFSLTGLSCKFYEFPGFSDKILDSFSLFRKIGEISGNPRKAIGVIR